MAYFIDPAEVGRKHSEVFMRETGPVLRFPACWLGLLCVHAQSSLSKAFKIEKKLAGGELVNS